MTSGNAWQTLHDEIQQQYHAVDRKISECIGGYARSGGHIHCGKGCRNCCNLAVNCTFPEALGVAAVLNHQQAARVKSHVLLLMEHVREAPDLKSYLRMHRKRIGFCPFLRDDGACGVYVERPFSCRSLLSTKESHWCSVDFGELSVAEKADFIGSLDRPAVSFPSHYLYATQDLGQQFEARASLGMVARFGFSLSGNLPFLVYLEREHHLSRIITQGYALTMNFLEQAGLLLPFLLMAEKL